MISVGIEIFSFVEVVSIFANVANSCDFQEA